MTELNGAVVLLTGAAGGFGQELTVQLMAAGSRLILSDRGEQAAALTAAYEKTPAVVGVFGADLGRTDECDGLYEAVRDLGTTPDILINNAGVAFYGRPDNVPGSRVDQLMRINLVSPMRLSQLFLPNMIEHGRGHIVNISSVAAVLGAGGERVHYAASKGAIDAFTLGLGRELGQQGIRVNAVRPGLIDTDMNRSKEDPDRLARLGPSVPMGRVGSAEEVAEAVLWLLSDAAGYVTGQVLTVSGGR